MEEILIGTTDRTILVYIPDPASTDGSGKTGVAHTDLTVSYTRVETDNDVVNTDVTSSLNALTNLTDAHNDWGWKEVSNTLAPGLYRLDVADALFASGAWYATLYVMLTSSAAAATPKQFNLVSNTLDVLGSKIDTIDDFLDTEVAAIKAKTDNLPSDPADASDITTSFTAVNTKLDTIDDFLDTEIAAIKAKTDNLPSDPADASDIATSFTTVNTKLDTIDDLLDTEVAAILSRIGTPADIDGEGADLASNAEAIFNNLAGGGASASDVWDLADGIETGETPRQTLRAIRAQTIGKSAILSGDADAGTVVFYRKDGVTVAVTVTYNASSERTTSTPGTLT